MCSQKFPWSKSGAYEIQHPVVPYVQVPMQRRDSHVVPEYGVHVCECAGTCKLYGQCVVLIAMHACSPDTLD